MNGFFYTIYHTKEQNVCFQMIPHMCRLVLMSGFYEELNIPTPHSRNAFFFITRLHIIGQKPKFRQCYFLVNIKNMKLHILVHIFLPVSDGTGGRTGYHHKSPRLLFSVRLLANSELQTFAAVMCNALEYKNKVWRAGLSWIFRARMAWWSHLQARRRSLRAC